MAEVYAKIHRVKDEVMVAICDMEILGRTFTDKNHDLSFEVKKSFYGGESMDVKDSLALLSSATIANLIGTRIVNEALKIGLLKPSAIVEIAGIPHAQIIKL